MKKYVRHLRFKMKKLLLTLFILVLLSGCTIYTYSCNNNDKPEIPPMVIEINAINKEDADGFALDECKRRNCDVSIKRLE